MRRNVIFERAQFNRRSQHKGETAQQYIMELYTPAEHCEYGDLKDEMICDHLVVGIRDAALSQLLQLDTKLTLETAKLNVHQREAASEQQTATLGTAMTHDPGRSLPAETAQQPQSGMRPRLQVEVHVNAEVLLSGQKRITSPR